MTIQRIGLVGVGYFLVRARYTGAGMVAVLHGVLPFGWCFELVAATLLLFTTKIRTDGETVPGIWLVHRRLPPSVLLASKTILS